MIHVIIIVQIGRVQIEYKYLKKFGYFKAKSPYLVEIKSVFT